MKVHVTGSNIEITDALESYIQDKMEKLEKFHETISNANVTLEVERNTNLAHGKINLQNFEAAANATDADMYVAIDMMVDKLLTQISKHKDKLIDKQHHRT